MIWKESIEQARRAALEALQPTPSQLEHGLELHNESIVVESYGLGLQAAPDGEAMAAAAESGASDAELQLMRETMRMTRWATDETQTQEYRDVWEAAGVTCTFQNAGEEGNEPIRLMRRLAHYTYLTDRMRGFVNRAAFPDDIARAKEEGRHCLYLMANGVPQPQDWISKEGELGYIRVFFELGCRMMHLTYNRRNAIGDGCAEPANGGLSDFGRAVVDEMNRVGVIVDVAHSGWQTGLDAAAQSSKPMVSSHSACAGLRDHHRCKPDELMKAIADTGGTLGITNVPAFLGGSGDIRAFLDHIDYAVKTVGADHVTIGTDRAYMGSRVEEEEGKMPARPRARTRWEALWQVDDPVSAPEWRQEHQVQSLAWTNWPLFTVGLVQRGHSDSDIQKIIGGNILRVARQVLE